MIIKRVVFDVDGVFTNGQFIYDAGGKQYKIFGAHDSDGVRMLRFEGIQVDAISGDRRGFSITKKRMEDIGIEVKLVSEVERTAYFQNSQNLSTTCFMGDGHYDSEVFKIVAYSIAPANAVNRALESANFVTNSRGGEGAVYEASLHILNELGD